MGKGWYATTLSNYIDNATTIPKYILEAIAFASKEVISLDIILKMIEYSLSKYDGNTVIDLKKENKEIKTNDEKNEIIKKFKSEYENDVVTKFLREVEKYCKD